MRGLLNFLIAFMVFVPALTLKADVFPIGGDDPVGWPWGAEVPFPFEIIKGVWHANLDDGDYYFTMSPVFREPGGAQLLIKQINPNNCKAIATGVAVIEGRIAFARMQVSSNRSNSYRIYVRAFPAQHVSSPINVKPIQGKYVVMTLAASDGTKEMTSAVELVSSRIPPSCK